MNTQAPGTVVSLLDYYKVLKRQGNFKRKQRKRREIIMNTSKKSDSKRLKQFQLNQCENSQQIDLDQDNLHINCELSAAHSDEIDHSDDVTECYPDWFSIEEDSVPENEIENGTEDINAYDGTDFRNELTQWAIQHQPPKHQLKHLLDICNRTLPFRLPRDPRTIMGTPRTIHLQNLSNGGQYWHHGVRIPIEIILQGLEKCPDKISLNVNVDGLPLFESSKEEFWPILCNIFELPHLEPFVVGIFCEKGMTHFLSIYAVFKKHF